MLCLTMCTWLLQLGIFILFNILVMIQIFSTIEYYMAATSCTLTLVAIKKNKHLPSVKREEIIKFSNRYQWLA